VLAWRSLVLAALISLTIVTTASAAKCPQPQGVRSQGEYAGAFGTGTWSAVTGNFEETAQHTFTFTGTSTFVGTYFGVPEELDGTISGTLNCGKEEHVEELTGDIGGTPVSETTISDNEYNATEIYNGVFTNNYGETGTYHGRILPEPPEITGIAPIEGSGGGGTKVKISGRYLKEVTGVLFGANESRSYKANAAGTLITAESPPQTPGPGGAFADVSVNTTGGSVRYLFQPFNYLSPSISKISPKTGPAKGGTVVTIKGTYLSDAQVLFNLLPASEVAINSAGTMIKATSPPEAPGPAFVTVRSPGGESISFGLFTYVVPTITSVTPASGPAGGGTKVTIKGTGFKGVTGEYGVVFGDMPATSYVVNAGGTLITAQSPAGAAGPIDVRVTTPALGVSQIAPADEFTYVS
jgi:IPT/TIG domain